MQKTLILFSSSAYETTSAKEGLDLALVLGTFEQPVSLAFSGEGVSLLLESQSPEKEHGKHLYKLLDGLEFYDIDDVYALQSDIELYNSKHALWEGVTSLDQNAWAKMLQTHSQIIRF
ncbi:DsrE family protein [Marinomonas balearica]|uniref:tRNA 2-thiouridine synthesizing protein C n=1 Tax=Marinomonas balearica TaxID=491947 RepID=A0A4R6MBE2_9GAMM|nr:DsrE family protein [Marinomonas balearica]TDO98911.1 tRNA 2-thiouridine synthesizing protein C [Marinomonas balearica]